jgi:uncharacterized protein
MKARFAGAVWRWLVATAAFVALGGCATYTDTFGSVEAQLAVGDYDAALEALERQRGAARDEVLYLLNRAMLLRMKRDLRASNEAFEAAKARMEELYGTSLREQTLSFVINDGTKSYVGEEYEQVLVHLYEALNYLELGDVVAARVEALQMDLRLREFGERFAESRHGEEAFARYLSGLIFDGLGERSDALIAYRRAGDAYRREGATIPQALQLDLLRLTAYQGLTPEHERYRKEFGITVFPSVDSLRNQGELVFVFENGLAPIKREHSVTAPDLNGRFLVRISLPYYDSHAPETGGARVQALAPDQTVRTAASERVQDVDAIARANLSAKMPAITARAVARAVSKRIMSRAAQESARSGNDRNSSLAAVFVGLGVEITGLLTERADTRSWLTLPHEFQLARASLPPGTWTVKVDFIGTWGQVLATREYPGVTIAPGRKTYLSHHWVGPPRMPTRR